MLPLLSRWYLAEIQVVKDMSEELAIPYLIVRVFGWSIFHFIKKTVIPGASRVANDRAELWLPRKGISHLILAPPSVPDVKIELLQFEEPAPQASGRVFQLLQPFERLVIGYDGKPVGSPASDECPKQRQGTPIL